MYGKAGLFLVLMTFAASLCQAEIQGEVIAAYNGTVGRMGVMPASGNVPFQYIDCGGIDLTHNGAPRYWLATEVGTSVVPPGVPNTVLTASDEDCQQTLLLFAAPNIRFDYVRWSHDGNRIAVHALVYDVDTGALVEDAICVAEVIRDGTGRPVAIGTLVPLVHGARALFAWSGDDQRIAYIVAAPRSVGGTQTDIWVHDIPSGVDTNITNSPDYSEDAPDYSPVAERIAFHRRPVNVKGSSNYDIFTISASGGTATRITGVTSGARKSSTYPGYSPDGQYLLYLSDDNNYGGTERDLYRIKSDGSGKATNLTGKQTGLFGRNLWRR